MREVHKDKRLRVRQKQQPSRSVVIYVIVRDKHGKVTGFTESSLRDRNGIIKKEIEKLEEFHRSENSRRCRGHRSIQADISTAG